MMGEIDFAKSFEWGGAIGALQLGRFFLKIFRKWVRINTRVSREGVRVEAREKLG